MLRRPEVTPNAAPPTVTPPPPAFVLHLRWTDPPEVTRRQGAGLEPARAICVCVALPVDRPTGNATLNGGGLGRGAEFGQPVRGGR